MRERRPRKLTPDNVREILRRVVDGHRAGKNHHPDNATSLAREFNVSVAMISMIARRKRWRSVKAAGAAS